MNTREQLGEKLKACRDPVEAKRLLQALFRDKLQGEDSDAVAIGSLLAEALETNRLVIKERYHKTRGAHPHLAASLHDIDWWIERLNEIEGDTLEAR